VHIEGLEEQVRFVTHALLQALEFSTVKVILQNGLVVGMRALVDDDTGTFTGRETTDVRQTLETPVSTWDRVY
jgi:hypothetical protein